MSDRIVYVGDGNGNYHEESLDKYIAEHPQDFYRVVDGEIEGSIPVTAGTVDMVLASESVEIVELPFDDVVIHPHK